MLETSQERVVLLKAGFKGKEIETLYLLYNGFTVVRDQPFFEPDDFTIKDSKKITTSQEATPELSL